MSSSLNKNQLEKYSRQIILKNIGILGQKKIINSKVLIIGIGGLGCPVAEFLTRSGIGVLGIVDNDLVSISNIHRQSLYDQKDLNKSKVKIAQKKLKNINPKIKVIRTTLGGSLNLSRKKKNKMINMEGIIAAKYKFTMFCIEYKIYDVCTIKTV